MVMNFRNLESVNISPNEYSILSNREMDNMKNKFSKVKFPGYKEFKSNKKPFYRRLYYFKKIEN